MSNKLPAKKGAFLWIGKHSKKDLDFAREYSAGDNIMHVAIAPCWKCERWYDEDGDVPNIFACEAFPEGIPEEILKGRNDHKNPVKGDGGLTFLERKKE